jgi:hypothetical protein
MPPQDNPVPGTSTPSVDPNAPVQTPPVVNPPAEQPVETPVVNPPAEPAVPVEQPNPTTPAEQPTGPGTQTTA